MQRKILARALALPIASVIAFTSGGVAIAQNATSVTRTSVSVNGTSTDHIITPDGTADDGLCCSKQWNPRLLV